MPTAAPLTETFWNPTPSGRLHLTRTACEFLENSGLLDGRYELIAGEIISKVQNYPHSESVSLVFSYVLSLAESPRYVRSQATLEVRQSDQKVNRPEPDVFLLREPVRRIAQGTDVLLLIEVSESTQETDLKRKPALYARAGVTEYWVLDLERGQLTVFRENNGESWGVVLELAEDESIAPICAPEKPVCVGSLLV
jgi:Uma2 family endonuclease